MSLPPFQFYFPPRRARAFFLHRPRSGFVASVPTLSGDFVLAQTPDKALAFRTEADAERFKERYRDVLGGGWRVVLEEF